MKIGIDLGGTKTEAILIDDTGKEIFKKRIITEKNYQGTLDGIKSLINEIENKYQTVSHIGIGMPGAISSESTLIKNANSIWLNNKPLKKDLETLLNKKINLENDANCFALSEAVDGAGKDFNIVFGVIIGTGVGGGIVVNKKIIRGRNKIGGEWGHTPLPNRTDNEKEHSNKCYCGLEGCMETYVSGPGFSSIFNSKYNENYDSQQIVEGFNKGESRCIESLQNYVDHLARGLSNIINILDPDIIILGGGMSNINYIYDNINEYIKKYVFSNTLYTRVVKNFHGDSGGVRGAAWL